MERRTKAATESGVLLLIVAAILVAVNILSAMGGYKRIDVTKNERFTLSKGSGNLLRTGMKQEMKCDVYVTRGLPKLDAFVRDLRDLLLEYKAASGGKFDFTLIEAKDEDQKKAAKEAGLLEQPFGEAAEGEEKAAVTQGFMGIVFKYGSEKDAIKFLPPDRSEGLEFWITNKIREVRDRGDGVKHKIGVVSGKDEFKLTDTNLVPSQMGKPSLQQIVLQNFPFYQFVDVDLKDGGSEIDDTLDGLIITQPNKDYTEKELKRVNQFVMKGKSLVVVASAVNVKASDAQLQATLNTHGLEKLLAGYGIELRKDVVLDFGRPFRVGVMTQAGLASMRFPQFLDVQDNPAFTGDEALLDTSFAGFFRLPVVAFPLASSLVLNKSKQPDVAPDKFRVIARSTPRSLRETTDSVDLKPFRAWKPKGEFSQQNLAATLEGTLRTAFPSGDGITVPEKSEKPARVLVIASSQFLTNPFARAGNGPDMGQMGMMMPGGGGDEQLLQVAGPYAQQALTNTILAFKNTLDWMTGDTDLLAVSAKIISEPNLVYGEVSKPKFEDETDEQIKKREEDMKHARKRQQHWIEATLILIIPLLFALVGVFRRFRRDAARASVSLA